VALTDEVREGIEGLRASFPDSPITIEETGDGGAWIRVEDLLTGPAFLQPTSWFAFQISYSYPEADIYPHFVRADLSRRDGQPLGVGLSQPVGCWLNGALTGTQVSRRTNVLDATTNDAAGKLMKVQRWLAKQ
jgi:hypothetical protein